MPASHSFALMRSVFTPAAAAVLLACPALSSAAAVLNVDFNTDTTAGVPANGQSPTASGFQGVYYANASSGTGNTAQIIGTDSLTNSGVSFVLAGDNAATIPTRAALATELMSVDANGDLSTVKTINARDRGAFSSPVSDFYRDFVTADGFGLELKGLTAGTQYAVTLYNYDNNSAAGRAETYTQYVLSGNALAATSNTASRTAVGNGANAPQTLAGAAATLIATADANGKLYVLNTGAADGTVATLNGITVAATPEPASLGLMAVAAAALLRCRR